MPPQATSEMAQLSAGPNRSEQRVSGIALFKAVLLEGLEVRFIVVAVAVAVGAGHGLLGAAALGALAACAVVLAIGVAARGLPVGIRLVRDTARKMFDETYVPAAAKYQDVLQKMPDLQRKQIDADGPASLMQRAGQVVTRMTLFEVVWRYLIDEHSTNVIDVHIGRLLREVGARDEPPMIFTVRGAGHVLRALP